MNVGRSVRRLCWVVVVVVVVVAGVVVSSGGVSCCRVIATSPMGCLERSSRRNGLS